MPPGNPGAGYGPVLQIHCLDQHGTIRFHEVRQVFPPGFMLDALAACFEDPEVVFVVAVEVIVERFAAYCTRNGLVSVLTFKKYNHAHWIIVCTGIRKNQHAFIKHTEHP